MQPSKLVVLPVLQVVRLAAVLSIAGPQDLVRFLKALDVDAFDETGLPHASKKAQKTRALGSKLGVFLF